MAKKGLIGKPKTFNNKLYSCCAKYKIKSDAYALAEKIRYRTGGKARVYYNKNSSFPYWVYHRETGKKIWELM